MPLVTGADFGLRFPQGNTNNISPIVNALGGLIKEKKESDLLKQRQQAETLQKAFKATALDLLDIAKGSDITQKKQKIIDMAKRAKLRGEDSTMLSNLLSYTTNDDMDTAILQIAHRAGDQDKLLADALEASKPTDQFEPVYQNGEIVAQRNVSTNKVIDDPRSKSSQYAQNKNKLYQPITLVNDETQEKMLVMPVGDPITGEARLAQIDMPEGFGISKETPEEQRAADQLSAIETSAKQVTSKGKATRGQGDINRGITAADSMANLSRGIELLGMVDTGGSSAVAIKARQMFGVESADEAELSNRLGKAVLSQLRKTFGAAFTAKEGAELKAMEASMTKSAAGNKRLLQQAMKIATRAANRGIKAAVEAEDYEAAQLIKDSMNFKLGYDELTPEEEAELKLLEAKHGANP